MKKPTCKDCLSWKDDKCHIDPPRFSFMAHPRGVPCPGDSPVCRHGMLFLTRDEDLGLFDNLTGPVN